MLLLAGSPSWKSEFPHHMLRCKIPILSIVPIGNQLKENNFISNCKFADNATNFPMLKDASNASRTNNPLCLRNYLNKRDLVKSYLDSHLYCNPGLSRSLPHMQFLRVVLLAGSPSWKSEFLHHMSRRKIPILSIHPIGSPLKESNYYSNYTVCVNRIAQRN